MELILLNPESTDNEHFKTFIFLMGIVAGVALGVTFYDLGYQKGWYGFKHPQDKQQPIECLECFKERITRDYPSKPDNDFLTDERKTTGELKEDAG